MKFIINNGGEDDMDLKYYVVDAFADEVFKGNPAAVFVLDNWLDDELMQNIAIENNLSETAFTVNKGTYFELRWFTPDREIDLCGHATLATAFVVFNFYRVESSTLEFRTRYSGKLFVSKEDQSFKMDFPAIMPEKVTFMNEYEEAIGAPILETYLGRDLFFVLRDEQTVSDLKPNFSKLEKLEQGVGVIVTAPGENVDFVSRTFFPKLTINEDPVCGSAHSNLIPYWGNRLDKNQLRAVQLSKRTGKLDCELIMDRVTIAGEAILFANGIIHISDLE